jgi:hypothetical protein
MSEQEPVTKVGAKLEAKLNLGDYNHAGLTLWVEDRVREDLDDNKASKALDRLVGLLEVKIEKWAKGFQDDPGTK